MNITNSVDNILSVDCPLCGKFHTTGLVRKLLCRDCNSALGLLKENKKTINNLIKYLENYGNI